MVVGKRYKKVMAVLLVMCMTFSGCSKAKEEETKDIASVKLKSDQEIVACKITAIYGNEIEYTVVKEQSMSDDKKDKMPSASGAPDMNNGDMPQGMEASDMNEGDMSQGRKAPDMGGGDMPQGGVPDMNNGNSDKRSDSSDSKSLDKSNDQKTSSDSLKNNNSSDKNGKKVYTLTDETGSVMIPVGTDVITSLGKTTTFSRLSNGDIIKMILEKDSDGEKVVVGVWIVS